MRKRCEDIVEDYPAEIFERAVRYLYAKESKSSHEIERETPDQKRAEKFIGLLQQAWHRDFLNKPAWWNCSRPSSNRASPTAAGAAS